MPAPGIAAEILLPVFRLRSAAGKRLQHRARPGAQIIQNRERSGVDTYFTDLWGPENRALLN